MRPQDLFWLSPTKYRLTTSEREYGQLRADELRKQTKISKSHNRTMIALVFTVVSHGLLLPLALISLRSTSVAKSKLKVIQKEIRDRRMAKYADDLQQLERINGRPFHITEIDGILQMLERGEMDEDLPTFSIADSRDAYGASCSYSDVRHDAPPPYETSELKSQ